MFRLKSISFLQQRWKSKTHWSVLQRKKTNTDRALESFDDFYGSVYGLRWRKMRVAMLTEHKYIAMINNFGDTEQISSELELNGAINVKSLVDLGKARLLEEEPLFSKDTTYKMDDKLGAIIKQQETQEKMSIYPVDGKIDIDDLPEKLQYREEAEISANVIDNELVDGKKSLEQAFKEDLEIDYTRLVDTRQGSGALYEYIPANKIKGMEDWIPESEHYRYYQTTEDFPLQMEMEKEFTYPQHLHLYTYEMGNCSRFLSPRPSLTGVSSHFLMDGASILPPLFLDVQPGERVLDACAAPGGKSLLLLQTLNPELLVCNDIQESRTNRIRRLMREFLCDYKEQWEGKRLIIQQRDARNLSEYDSYDKILVDVPCTTDRHALNENDNNLFKPTRIKERLRIPELQAGILTNCLRLLRPGGTLVYSTCSLSPVQNDGVVHMALQRVFHEHGITTTIRDLSVLMRLFNDIFMFEQPRGLKYGQMVVPYLPANFGPLYLSKITRNT